MTTTLRLCCGVKPCHDTSCRTVSGVMHSKDRYWCTNCWKSTAWHATAEGAESEWNGREKKDD
jgi:hypothetical protein